MEDGVCTLFEKGKKPRPTRQRPATTAARLHFLLHPHPSVTPQARRHGTRDALSSRVDIRENVHRARRGNEASARPPACVF